MDIDLLDNAFMEQQMTWMSAFILAIGLVAGIFMGLFIPHEEVNVLWFILLVALSLVALPVHELVHAFSFAVLSHFTARIRFGVSNWMLYTMAPGTMLTKYRYLIVLLAPTITVTSVLFGVSFLCGWPLLGWFLAVIHLAGCTGDLVYVRIILRDPSTTHVEDTERGIALFHDN